MTNPEDTPKPDRRGLLARLSTWLMAGGLFGGYGALGGIAARFLFPARKSRRAWLFVMRADEFAKGRSLAYRTPTGERVVIARHGEAGEAADFVALSSTCPHLGCQVHWEAANQRFFCPCHNGAFAPDGRAIAGPPAEAKQQLARFPLELRDGLLFMEVPIEGLGEGSGARA